MLRADLLLLLRKYTPLHKAADSESVQLLITAKSNPNAEDHVIGLITANVIDLCGVELCGLLLQLEATALHTAVMDGHIEAVQLLLTAKSNPNAEDGVSDCDGNVRC